MITSREYDQLCKVTDELRTATEALYTAGVTGDIKEAARQFVMAEDAWEAFTIRLVEDTAATNTDDWVEYSGGGCPLAEGTVIDVRYRDGGVVKELKALCFDRRPRDASESFWARDGYKNDIIAYRVVS